tara:strand:+ start:228 stop:488 length:261 start_codon:yes stop_codon:yes gene_type:complete
MKTNITIKKEDKFEPFTLELVIETEQEAYALLALALTTDSVSNVVYECWGKNTGTKRYDIMQLVRNILTEIEKSDLKLDRYRGKIC